MPRDLREWYVKAVSLNDARAFVISRARIGVPVAVIAQQCGEPLVWVQWVVSTFWLDVQRRKAWLRLPRHGWYSGERAA